MHGGGLHPRTASGESRFRRGHGQFGQSGREQTPCETPGPIQWRHSAPGGRYFPQYGGAGLCGPAVVDSESLVKRWTGLKCPGMFVMTNALIVLVGLMTLLMAETSWAKERVHPRATVLEPFLEIRTGAGRSYPVFYIAEKDEVVVLLKQRTDWIKVALSGGQEGWVHQDEIEKTLRGSDYQKGWRERFYDEHIDGRLQAGWAWGTFDGDNALYVRTSYLLTEAVSVEGSLGFASGAFGDTRLYLGGLVMTPWRGQGFVLNGTLGGGWVQTHPADVLINVKKDDFPAVYAGLGFSTPLFRRLALRGDFRNYTLFINPKRNREFQEYSLGLIFAF